MYSADYTRASANGLGRAPLQGLWRRGLGRFVRVQDHELGRRLFLLGWRCHHWHVGMALLWAGCWYVWHDRIDLRLAFERSWAPPAAKAGQIPVASGRGSDHV